MDVVEKSGWILFILGYLSGTAERNRRTPGSAERVYDAERAFHSELSKCVKKRYGREVSLKGYLLPEELSFCDTRERESRFTPDEKRVMVKYLREALEIAAATGCSNKSIHRWARLVGIDEHKYQRLCECAPDCGCTCGCYPAGGYRCASDCACING